MRGRSLSSRISMARSRSRTPRHSRSRRQRRRSKTAESESHLRQRAVELYTQEKREKARVEERLRIIEAELKKKDLRLREALRQGPPEEPAEERTEEANIDQKDDAEESPAYLPDFYPQESQEDPPEVQQDQEEAKSNSAKMGAIPKYAPILPKQMPKKKVPEQDPSGDQPWWDKLKEWGPKNSKGVKAKKDMAERIRIS